MYPPYHITLPVTLTNANTGRGRAWYASASERKRMEAMLRKLGLVREPFAVPVRVTVTRILGKGQRLWDSSSVLRGNYKELEDAMVACGWFHDDSAKWITETDGRQDASRREDGPSVCLRIDPA